MRLRWRSTDSLADLYLPVSPGEWLERLVQQSINLVGLALKLLSYLGLGACRQRRVETCRAAASAAAFFHADSKMGHELHTCF